MGTIDPQQCPGIPLRKERSVETVQLCHGRDDNILLSHGLPDYGRIFELLYSYLLHHKHKAKILAFLVHTSCLHPNLHAACRVVDQRVVPQWYFLSGLSMPTHRANWLLHFCTPPEFGMVSFFKFTGKLTGVSDVLKITGSSDTFTLGVV